MKSESSISPLRMHRSNHRRSQDFVWGVHFFSRRPQRLSKYTSKSSKNYPENWLLLWLGGVHFVSWGALSHFSCKLGLKKIFTTLGVQVHPLHPWIRLWIQSNTDVCLQFTVPCCSVHDFHVWTVIFLYFLLLASTARAFVMWRLMLRSIQR